jgi:hypothetical protein
LARPKMLVEEVIGRIKETSVEYLDCDGNILEEIIGAVD